MTKSNLFNQHKITLNIIFALIISACAIISGCGDKDSKVYIEKFKNGKIKFEKTPIAGESLRFICKEFYPDGGIKSTYSIKENLYHGFNQNYYDNGKIQSEGQWYMGKKIGTFKYFDNNGKLEKIIEFIPFRDSVKSRPNQLFRIGVNGDTLLNGSSLYYEYYRVSDTVKNGDAYRFKIVLRGHKFDKAHLRICDFDENYRGGSKCEGLDMDSFQTELTLKKYNVGENTLRGVIINYNTKDSKSEEVKEHVDVYFTEKFYVLP